MLWKWNGCVWHTSSQDSSQTHKHNVILCFCKLTTFIHISIKLSDSNNIGTRGNSEMMKRRNVCQKKKDNINQTRVRFGFRKFV